MQALRSREDNQDQDRGIMNHGHHPLGIRPVAVGVMHWIGQVHNVHFENNYRSTPCFEELDRVIPFAMVKQRASVHG